MTSMEMELQRLEEQLLNPVFRLNREWVSSLLAEEFCEFGSSGRVFNKEQILNLLADESGNYTFSIMDFHAEILAPDVVLVTYRSSMQRLDLLNPAVALRSSIWMKCDGRWKIRFHQGTKSSREG